MDPERCLWVLLVCLTILLCDGVEGGRWNISVKENLEFKRQLKILNKPFIKTILTVSGDIFDCVDFYKQPAFDYALLNNYTIEYEVPYSLRTESRDPKTSSKACPIGSVPIKRITKEDLIREKLASTVRTSAYSSIPGSHYAVVRTKLGINKFVGAGGVASVWTPQVSGQQYSAARLKIANGPDSIEVGWRVDPSLYGDTICRLYTRTVAGRSHCFDGRCGFVIVREDLAVGNTHFDLTSKRGGSIYDLELAIVQDTITGNWYLECGEDHSVIGFWPKNLFTGLANLGASAEWGGEVFSPPGTPKPAMGAGFIPKGKNDDYDAYFRRMVLIDEQNIINVDELDSFDDKDNYEVRDVGIQKDSFYSHLMFYGGSASSA